MEGQPVLVVGSGAMACLFAARLAGVTEVTLLGSWTAGLDAIRERGIRIEKDGETEVARVNVASRPEDVGHMRHALVLVKSWQTVEAARRLQACLESDGVALTLQNGLGNLDILQQALGAERAAQGITMCGATLVRPGHVRWGGAGPTILARHPRLGGLLDVLRRAGFDPETQDDMQAVVWGKLAVNAGINPLAALLGLSNGDLVGRPDARRLMQTAAAEVQAVALALGIQLPYADAAERVVQVAERTAGNTSSMLQDMRRGAPTEIDAISGAVADRARRSGRAALVNETLWRLVRAAVAGRKGASDEGRDHEG
jgi:2-dehydropantoate 2-reductase